MKKLNLKRIKLIPVSLGFLLCAQAHHAKAANLYFCPSGSPPVNGGSYSWDDPNWSTSTSCSSPGAWQQGSFPEFHGGSISYTVTVNNTEQYVGLYNSYDAGSTATLIITNAGSGNLQLQPNASLTDGFPTQGHFGSSSGSTTKIYAPITGTGGVNVPASSGNLYLLGNNTYSGGTTFSSTATLCYFNNNNSFGSGYCCSSVGAGSFANILSTGGSSGSPLTITLPNNWTNGHGGYINFASTAYTPVVCTGNWQLGNFAMNIRNNGDTTASLTLSGVISGPGSTMTFSGQNGGKITLSGANTYSGATTIAASGGTSPIVVSVASINSVTTPAQSASSSLGKPSAGNGTISLGSAASSGLGGTLIYTGSGETSDRAINLAGTTGGATIEMDGAGPLVLTSAFTASGAGSKTLTLQGSSTAANTIGGAIVDNSSVNKTTVVKAQAGTWKLSGASTYTGGTTVSNGTLEVAGSIAGNVTVQGGVLQLDSPTALSSGTSATVTLAGSLPNHSVNLNFSGTQPINALIIGGVSQPVGTYGASGADHNLAVFTGSGLLNVAGAPTVTTQPQSVAVWAGGSATFTVAATGAPTYQWKRNGANVGANSSALTINPVGTGNAGTYVCWLTNAYGWTVTSNAYLTVRSENAYTAAITNEPGLISYYRLDETGGTTAYDCFGNNNGTYNNAIQGVTPGAIAIDPNDACVNLATNKINNNKSYVSIPGGATAFNFFAPSGLSANFTLECWAYFTNLTFTPQRMFSSVNSGFADGYGFGISSANQLEFSCFGYEDYNAPLTTPLQLNTWYHLAVSSSGTTLTFYLNGNQVWQTNYFLGLNSAYAGTTGGTMNLGNDLDGTYGFVSEQFMGLLDEVAVYNVAVPQADLYNHYQASLATIPVSQTPQADYPTNYVTRTTTLFVTASGQDLQYQWACNGQPLAGATDSALVLSPLDLSSNQATFTVGITNGENSAYYTNPPGVKITVLPIPTMASQVGLTNGLVLHLPLTNNPADISGYHHDGTNVGANLSYPSDPQALGGGALQVSSGGGNGFNYVNVGSPANLDFGAATDFSVSLWIKQTYGQIATNVPYIGTAVGGIGATGWCFAPAYAVSGPTATPTGAPEWSIEDLNGHNIAVTGPSGSIDDGNWHNVIGVFTRSSIGQLWIDGNNVGQQAIFAVGDMGNTNLVIGQDPTGSYGGNTALATTGLISDVGVWRLALSPVQIAGLWLAGSQNTPAVSFAPPITLAPPPQPTTISNIVGTTLTYGGGQGSQFVLIGTNNVTALEATWPRIATNNSTPGTFTVPVGSGTMFYRVKSE